jgi:Max protein
MRLKSMNKSNSITLSRKNNSTTTTTQPTTSNHQETNYEINSSESGYLDLNMDSGDDEIDVGTHADSMLMSFSNNNSNTSENSFKSLANTSAATSSLHNDNHFGSNDSPNGGNSFAMPQSASAMTEADRKRAHHNALERKRRDHIKDSFHTLRDAIPNIKGEKVSTSRAQILKAATDYIKTMKTRNTIFQTDIDSLKKQNNEIELQIRQLEKAKMSNNECVRQQQSFQIKNELDLNDTTPGNLFTDNHEFKYELNENNNNNNSLTTTTNTISSNKNNVIVMAKPTNLLGSTPTTSKKFKTIVSATNKSNLLNNNGNSYF